MQAAVYSGKPLGLLVKLRRVPSHRRRHPVSYFANIKRVSCFALMIAMIPLVVSKFVCAIFIFT